MKKLILLLVLLVLVSVVADAQWKVITPRNGRTGTAYGSWSQAAQTDTTQVIAIKDYAAVFYSLMASDSNSTTISYMPSWDGQTFGAPVVIDSLSTATATSKSIPLPSGALGLRYVKFVRTVNVFRLGVSTPTLKENIVLVK